MVWYLVPSRVPKLVVAVGWEPVLGSFVGRVEGVPTGVLVDPDRPTVAWFGSRQGELQTVQDLQEAIGDYAALGSDVRAALEADRTAGPSNLSPQLPWDRCSWCLQPFPAPANRCRRIPPPAGRCLIWR